MEINNSEYKQAGYAYLINKFELNTFPLRHTSLISSNTVHRSILKEKQIEDIYPNKYWPGESVGDHLEFALKYDGVNLNCLNLIFSAVNDSDIIEYIQSKPTGKYARRIWFFYEFLTEKTLPIKDISKGNYTEALEPDLYYTINPGVRIQRQRIVNNLLGSKEFCPIVRKTKILNKYDTAELRNMCENIIANYPPELIKRALSYLYNKETKSSFAIENIKPNPSRTEKFINLLGVAEQEDFFNKNKLIDLQNRIVDPRFKDSNYRETQNYVGQTVSYQKEIIHYICPKPDDIHSLMRGLITSHQIMKEGNIPAVIHAAITAYGFVFLHPFEDGNGRIHRFLIHNILSLQNLVPKGLMFPVSAVILKNQTDYDNSLEAFSHPLMQLTEYDLDETGNMIVLNNTSEFYKYMDMTIQAEALHDFIISTIQNELTEELDFIVNYDNTKRSIQEVIDMPDKQIDRFIQFCLQNKGNLSIKKRTTYFSFLTNNELILLEKAVKSGYKL
ncbi:MAG: Fic family protein [Candidatus Delongbacteria bacterium]|jgi:hypothetical protein|nr:Fic family protein [Candidatus Delongbacteria bacterium]